MTMKKTLTLAGSDSSGGAGIQADLKTFQEHDVYGMTALTSIVTMNPDGWSHHVSPIDVSIVEKQLDTILSVGVDAMKTGMLGSFDIIELGAKKIEAYHLSNYVLDPVMVCKGDDEVLQPENTDAMRELLLPHAVITTPNLFEAGQLAQTGPIRTLDDMKQAAVKIHELGAKHVVIKGGKAFYHEKAIDLFYDGQEFTVLEEDKINTSYNHGAGCTFAAAITANLAKGRSVKDSVTAAKNFVTAAIKHGWKLNEYVGPVRHGAYNKYTN
ncbi:hydroxymethylpyrimidine/phosphomethylpyrimidine kinase [Virgibacillus pantothenticus]|uniref:pyridoxine/pyridoxal/pyridoxamine kinase n=1 Tax=Virgibacillus TaxID=84406 RepID=UPI00090A1721|nr:MULTISPECIES: pyridoxine/pyridoxal/pyridoxamine kinase [Virgibacillus]API92746.1 bifunctional hydroxymethylpyrimidine kinase/phosphomethylpyrimidine kinase [Virgibacillus sp. 6R]MBS7428247.1 pyridoxine/pyridoxal/pyridoxamine kinase [Virgibacillus sp. 19R1-5]MBU8565319.1 pyridoxine/pyridoxal/pyridoxamine kinase [Virgibacillus pantothenticus]MBU8599461.1 pyridoxine/pyridoxal/pyridoxamine kinase [Virgibacillus pantothenticus]MBU8633639.1 pyridoxine/pyridoxal/pyridoxamine kinase [Virgibacillus 